MQHVYDRDDEAFRKKSCVDIVTRSEKPAPDGSRYILTGIIEVKEQLKLVDFRLVELSASCVLSQYAFNVLDCIMMEYGVRYDVFLTYEIFMSSTIIKPSV